MDEKRALVVYDSVFGNTKVLAQAMAAALGCDALPVAGVALRRLDGLQWLVVGSPTRGFRPSDGMATWLKGLPMLAGVQTAAFDTRIVLETIRSAVFRFLVDKGGYAAPSIARALQKQGAKLVVPPEGFYVMAQEGPLRTGEVERAADWARRVGQ